MVSLSAVTLVGTPLIVIHPVNALPSHIIAPICSSDIPLPLICVPFLGTTVRARKLCYWRQARTPYSTYLSDLPVKEPHSLAASAAGNAVGPPALGFTESGGGKSLVRVLSNWEPPKRATTPATSLRERKHQVAPEKQCRRRKGELFAVEPSRPASRPRLHGFNKRKVDL